MKKSLNVLFVLLTLNVAVAQEVPCCENECDNISIYGDTNDNIPTQIKHYGGFTYLSGTVNIGGQLFATLTKFDANNGVSTVGFSLLCQQGRNMRKFILAARGLF